MRGKSEKRKEKRMAEYRFRRRNSRFRKYSVGRSRSWVERYTHEILQKRHQNPGAISRYFNAQKAEPSLDPRWEGPSVSATCQRAIDKNGYSTGAAPC